MDEALRTAAGRALSLLDLTNLDEDCDRAAVAELCRRASTPHGNVAALCVWPKFARDARTGLDAQPDGATIHVACVANFPGGGDRPNAVADIVRRAAGEGADEIDVVMDWRSFLAGDEAKAAAPLTAARKAAQDARLKVILETGELNEDALIRRASEIAVAEGADFIKTSTGKVPANATPEAVKTMLSVIKAAGRTVGLKPSGGIRTVTEAARYLEFADAAMGPGWASPETFRFGASSLLDSILATLDDRVEAEGTGY